MRSGNGLDTALSTTAHEPTPLFSTTTTTLTMEKSIWHSPMPYLFGGLATMLLFITFALLILACLYWKYTTSRVNYNNNNGENNDDRRDLEAADHKVMGVFEEKIVVIMAGDVKPTFLATPMSMKSSSSSSAAADGSLDHDENDDENSCDKERLNKDDEKLEKDQETASRGESHQAQESQEQDH